MSHYQALNSRIHSTETLTLQAVKKFLLICNVPFSLLSSSCYALEESMPLPFTMVVGKTLMTARQLPVEVTSTKAVYLEEGDAFLLPGTQCIDTGIGRGPMCFGNNRPTRISLGLGLSFQDISQRKYNVSFSPLIPEPLSGQVIFPEFDLGARSIVTTIQQGAERQCAITEAARQNRQLWSLRNFAEHMNGVAGEYAEEENETTEWWMSEEVLYGPDMTDDSYEVKIRYEDLFHEGMPLKPDARYCITPPFHNKTRISCDVPCDGESDSDNGKNQATRPEDSDSKDDTSSDEKSDSDSSDGDSKEAASSVADSGSKEVASSVAYPDGISTTDDLVSPSPAQKRKLPGHLKTHIETVHEGKKINDNGKDIACVSNELVVKILSNLGIRDISVCKRVNRTWKELIDESHLQARSFYLACLPPADLYSSQKAVERYHSSIRNWLTCFSDKGKELAERLGQLLMHKCFPEELFFSVAKVLAEAKVFFCQNIITIQYLDQSKMNRSPDGYHFVTVSHDNTVKIWGPVDGQWQEKATIRPVGSVKGVSFSRDGYHLVTTSHDDTAEVWGLVDGQWQEKATIQNTNRVSSVCFSSDGYHFVTTSHDYTAKIWGVVDGQWQEKNTIQHAGWVNSGSFSPDGNHLVTASDDHTAKIWGLVDGQWQEKTTIQHAGWVNSASFSPDGNYLVTASNDNTAKIWGLVDGQWQEKTIIQHTRQLDYAGFSPCRNHLITVSRDHIAKIWGFVNGQWQEKAIVQHNTHRVGYASFSPDGNHFVTVSRDHTAKIWGLLTGDGSKKSSSSILTG